MTPEQFTYWLQGYAEVSGKRPTKEQWLFIQEHLQLVFDKQTRAMAAPASAHDLNKWVGEQLNGAVSAPKDSAALIC